MGDGQQYTAVFEHGIFLPSDTRWRYQQAQKLMEVLLGTFERLAFSIVANNESIIWCVIDRGYEYSQEMIYRTIQSVYPDAQLGTRNYQALEREPFYRQVVTYEKRHGHWSMAPFPYVTDFRDYDPLVTLTQAMSTLLPGERVEYLVNTWWKIKPQGGLLEYGLNVLFRASMKNQEYRTRRLLEEKEGGTNYLSTILVCIDSPVKSRIAEIRQLISSPLSSQFERQSPYATLQQENNLDQIIKITTPQQDLDNSAMAKLWAMEEREGTWTRIRGNPLSLMSAELASFWHPPHVGMQGTRTLWADADSVEIPELLIGKTEGVRLGVGVRQGQQHEVFLAPEDRDTHVSIIGKVGMGKSTLLHNLIHQDIANGEGVAVIDPHGALVRDILRHSIPPEREQDVVLLDLADRDYPMPLNLFGIPHQDGSIGRIISVLERLYDTASAVRARAFLRASVSALLEYNQQPTMRDIPKLFVDDVFRDEVLDYIVDEEELEFWDDYEAAGSGRRREIREPITSRIYPFYGNKYLYPSLCHPRTLDFKELIEGRKIVLLSLDVNEAVVPTTERELVGALVLTLLQIGGMVDSRKKTDEFEPPPYYIYVDELQNFVTGSLQKILSEARKYGLHLVMANQFFHQLDEATIRAVMGTVGTNVVFRIGPDDARTVAAYMGPEFRVEDLVKLDRFQMAVKMQSAGKTAPAFSLATMPAPTTSESGEAREQHIRAVSRATHGMQDRTEVMKWLRERYPRRRRKPDEAESGDASKPEDDTVNHDDFVEPDEE